MGIQHNATIHISVVEGHDQNKDMFTLYHLPYYMLWHKYDAHVASLYFYLFRVCDMLFHHTFLFKNFGFYRLVSQIPIPPG